jgi:hypothetical protein
VRVGYKHIAEYRAEGDPPLLSAIAAGGRVGQRTAARAAASSAKGAALRFSRSTSQALSPKLTGTVAERAFGDRHWADAGSYGSCVCRWRRCTE